MFRSEKLISLELESKPSEPLKVLASLVNDKKDHMRFFRAEEAFENFTERFVKVTANGVETKGFVVGIQIYVDRIAIDFAGAYSVECGFKDITEFEVIDRQEAESFIENCFEDGNGESLFMDSIQKRINQTVGLNDK